MSICMRLENIEWIAQGKLPEMEYGLDTICRTCYSENVIVDNVEKGYMTAVSLVSHESCIMCNIWGV